MYCVYVKSHRTFYGKERILIKYIWEQDQKMDMWTQEGLEWGVEKASQQGTWTVCNVHLI